MKARKVLFQVILGLSIIFSTPSLSFSSDAVFMQEEWSLQANDSIIINDSIVINDTNIRARIKPFDLGLNYRDTVIFDYLFMPIVFEGKTWEDANFPVHIPTPAPPFDIDKYTPKIFAKKSKIGNFHERAYRDIIENNIDIVKYSYKDFPEEVEKAEEIRPNLVQLLFAIEYDPEKSKSIDKPERFAPKRRYWRYSGSHSIHFNQYHYSKNWYKGGSSFLNLISDQIFNFNYAKNNISFNNRIRWQLTQSEAKNDTLRRFKIDQDLLQIESSFNVKMFKNWTYTNRLELRTPVLNKYKENTNNATASFLCPLNITLGIVGGTYSLSKNPNKALIKTINFKVTPSPLTVNLDYIQDKKIGNYEGKQHRFKFGSSVDARLELKLYKDIGLTSRFKYNTTYESILVELENKLSLNLNRYFSVDFTFYPRFDDTRTDRNNPAHRDDTWGYVQVYDLLTFGFKYHWQ